jgi:cyclohexanone monooxygenase
MEGVSAEAASLAGHLGLGNLVWLYDDNRISIEGDTGLAFTEDVGKRFEGYGWQVQHVDGHDRRAVARALEIALDALVCATGYDALTGAVMAIDIRGRGGLRLREKWSQGPRTLLGIMTAGFPNLFIITGAGSPSVLVNMIVGIEHHVQWITDCMKYLQERGISTIEASVAAEDQWVAHVNAAANRTLLPLANSWF